MLNLPRLLLTLSMSSVNLLITAQSLTPDTNVPAGYQVGMATVRIRTMKHPQRPC